MPLRGSGFSPIYDSIAERRDINAQSRIVWAVLKRLQGTGISCYPAYETIARMAGCSRAQAIRCVRQLELADLVEVFVREKRTTAEGESRWQSNLFIVHETGTGSRKPHRPDLDRRGSIKTRKLIVSA